MAARGICAADRGEFTLHKRRSRIVAHSLIRAGKAVVIDIPISLRFNGFLNCNEEDWRVEHGGNPTSQKRDVGHPVFVAGSRFSKLNCNSELKLPGQRPQPHTGNDAVAAGSRAVDTCTVWIAGSNVVETIERIDAKLANDAFMDRNVFQQGKIISEEYGTEIIVSSHIAELGDVGASKHTRLRSVGAKGLPGNEVGPGVGCGAKRCET